MELICPSCEARYQVPETSIGEKGRQVSCMNCGHSWHAFPPLVLGSSAAPPTTASAGIDFHSPPRPGRNSSTFAASEAEAPAASPGPSSGPMSGPPAPPPRAAEPAHGPEPSRSEQLAEIREMLAEVQSEERAAAALVPDDDDRTRVPPGPQTGGDARRARTGQGTAEAHHAQSPAGEAHRRPAPLALEDDGSDDTDPLRRRMAMHDREADRKQTDVERLRRRHDRRSQRQKRARDVGSGAFLTGFLLVVMIAAAMTALYMLQPQIVARMPGTQPMLDEYVRTVDGVRGNVADGYGSARDWVLKLIDKNA